MVPAKGMHVRMGRGIPKASCILDKDGDCHQRHLKYDISSMSR